MINWILTTITKQSQWMKISYKEFLTDQWNDLNKEIHIYRKQIMDEF